MASETPEQETAMTPVREETKAMVDRNMPDEPDEIRQKMAELVELIKKRAETELTEAGEITHEAYLNAIRKAKETLNKTQSFFQEQEQSIEKSLQELTDEAGSKWEAVVGDLKKVGDRVTRAVDAAWKTLTESESGEGSSEDSSEK